MQSPDSSLPSSPAFSEDSGRNISQDYHHAIARDRWKILAQALQKRGPPLTNTSSVRRFQSYGLVSALPLQNICEDGATWYDYCATVDQNLFSVLVRHPECNFSASDLMGFNNTGNICVWPSEEVLAYFSLCNRTLFSCKSVLEVGGGMSCLAGLMVGKYTSATKVHLTDGNVISMENVRLTLERNGFGKSSKITSSVLQWGKQSRAERDCQTVWTDKLDSEPSTSQFDIILCADCLFFDDARHDLVQTIHDFMTDDGIALLTAPKRADTLQQFYNEATNAGFTCNLKEMYNEQIWDRHIQAKANLKEYYDENIHYPLLLQLQKAL